MSVIEHSVAVEEFDRICDDWEIDSDTTAMTEEDREDFEGHKAKIINAIKRGRLAFDGGEIKYTVSDKSAKAGDVVTISRPKGAGLMEMDKYKDRQGVHKTYAVLSSMTGKPPAYFSNLDGIDIKPFLAVVTLFLAS